MKTQPTNFCRSMVKEFTPYLEIPSVAPEMKVHVNSFIDLANASQKFMLPPGGRVLDDRNFKALDETDPLRLPYDFIALEYHAVPGRVLESQQEKSSRRIIFARQRENDICINFCWWRDSTGNWGPVQNTAYLSRTHYIERTPEGTKMIAYFNDGIGLKKVKVAPEDFDEELGTLFCFLNILQCSNIRTERLTSAKPGAKVKGALPFDTYHVLTVGSVDGNGRPNAGSHRSPREHLRRGHIRRYESGLKVWINAHVVNAGVGGKVTKDYLVAV